MNKGLVIMLLAFCVGACVLSYTVIKTVKLSNDNNGHVNSTILISGKPLNCVMFRGFSGTKYPSCDWAKFNADKLKCEVESLKRRTIKPNEQYPNGTFFPKIKGEC